MAMEEGGWGVVMGEGGLEAVEAVEEGGWGVVMGEGGSAEAEAMEEGGWGVVMGEGGCIRAGPDIKQGTAQSSLPIMHAAVP